MVGNDRELAETPAEACCPEHEPYLGLDFEQVPVQEPRAEVDGHGE